MSSNILFVFEGAETEKQIASSLNKYFINKNVFILCSYCNDIYELFKEIKADQDLDTFSMLKKIPINKNILANFKSADFAEIYLFFDYDGHDNNANDEDLIKVLEFFNEETAAGKIYVSYPMVEALKHKSYKTPFKDLKVLAKKNIKYKQIVDLETENILKQFNKYTLKIWLNLIDSHLKKMNYIVNDFYLFPNNYETQKNIFSNQIEKSIKIDETIFVLSAFPIFVFEYYGKDYIINLIENEI